LAGLATTAIATTWLLIPREVLFGIDSRSAARFVREHELADSASFYAVMTVAFEERGAENGQVIARLRTLWERLRKLRRRKKR
jgi:hypothetical protein